MTRSVEQRAKSILDKSETRITPGDFAKKLTKEIGITLGEARKVLKHLVSTGEVTYSYDFGSTHVEPSFLRPVRITDHFILTPWPTAPKHPLLEIIIAPGISFGSGRHPTTRLCLAAIDHALLAPCDGRDPPAPMSAGFPPDARPSLNVQPKPSLGRAADVGTGSGVLALAMVLAGCSSCLALDTDLNCASEAMHNAALNKLEKKIEVTTDLLNHSHGPFSVIAANLRFPTLKNLADLFYTLIEPQGTLILSGIKTSEIDQLISHYQLLGFTRTWNKNEKSWSAVVFQKRF